MSESPPVGLLHDFGADWQIQQEPGGLWVAIERPVVPVVRFHIADTPEQLRELLEADPRHRDADGLTDQGTL